MPQKANVYICHGPTSVYGEVKHRIDRLDGLQAVLNANNHIVILKKIMDREAVEIWVNGSIIFNCDIRNLDFGGDGQLDPLCESALNAVNNAF